MSNEQQVLEALRLTMPGKETPNGHEEWYLSQLAPRVMAALDAGYDHAYTLDPASPRRTACFNAALAALRGTP